MNTLQLRNFAELALAGYGQFAETGQPAIGDLTTLNHDEAGFSPAQASYFRYRFDIAVATFSDATSVGGSGQTRFDSTVFQGKLGEDASKVVIGFRGTGQQSPAEWPNDIQSALESLANGVAVSQIVQMFNWWQRVGTPKGSDVPQFMVAPDYLGPIRISDVKSTGEVATLLSETPGARLVATGSSLGGHLAMSFATLFPNQLDQAVVFNAPRFGARSGVTTLFDALGGVVPVFGI